MRLCLINPPHPYLIRPDGLAALGILYVASAAREAGHDVTFVNASRYLPPDVPDLLPDDCDLYGFAATSVDYGMCRDIALRLKKRNPAVKTILGGAHATVAPELVDKAAFDSICVGEGEVAIVRALDDLRNGRLQTVYSFPRVHDLSVLAPPARDLMDVQGQQIFADATTGAKNGSVTILHARGCAFSCAFCAAHDIWGGAVIHRSSADVLAEVRAVRSAYGITEFRFCDDTFNASRGRVRELCDALEPEGVIWRASCRAGISTADDFRRMYSAGCRELNIGAESGDQRVLDLLGKRSTVAKNIDAASFATEAGIRVRLLLMSGMPGERADSPERTRDFLAAAPFRMIALTQFRPLPGSAIWRDPARFGCRILDRDFTRYNVCLWGRDATGEVKETPVRSVIETDLLSRAQLEENVRRTRQYVFATGKVNRG